MGKFGSLLVHVWFTFGSLLVHSWFILVRFWLIVGSLLAVVYVWRVLEMAYLRRPTDSDGPVVREAPLSLLLPTWLLIGANLYFGIHTDLSVGIAKKAAALLAG